MSVIASIDVANAHAMAVRPPVGGFPYLAEAMRAAGVEKYLFDVPTMTALYLTDQGDLIRPGRTYMDASPLPATDRSDGITVLHSPRRGGAIRKTVGCAAVALWLFSLTACAFAPASSQPSPSSTVTTPSGDGAGRAACEDSGGTVQARQPTYGTNNDVSTWIAFGDPIEVCRYQTLGDQDSSRIYADLVSISSPNPTLAALAYLAKTPIPQDAQGNPAQALCEALGGASAYGASANGGGLVDASDPDDFVFAPCVFADGSFIEQWGIAYYSDGTVRGKDLAEVFAFDPSKTPTVFAD